MPESTQKEKEKKGEWTEHVDENSGATYYFNGATGETSWTNPVD